MPRLRIVSIGLLLFFSFAFLALFAGSAAAQETRRQYLSGHGKDDAVPWQFRCSSGAKAEQWLTIPVPSNWELHGFGIFSYGNDARSRPGVRGEYKTAFTVPADWAGLRVYLVFEGSMTDTAARLNGESVGPAHQGGFYRFKYEVTKLLKTGQENALEVTVDERSADPSINNAERSADYWNFAGIYRPVYLEAVPAEFVERVAIDARADGTIAISTFVNGASGADSVEGQILTTDGQAVGEIFSQALAGAKTDAVLKSQVATPRLWNAETPNLYQVEVRLKRGTSILHAMRQRFGFRTMEVRAGDGLYVNGQRIVLKGTNRHSFWPDSGRCTSEKLSREDVRLMKEMNNNAVRMSHYPPDQHLLDVCDEVGLYVLDELAGWHQKYDEPAAIRLVEQMVKRDVNHPCIVLWDNGNEGGWNTAVDGEFARWDPQRRNVLHPWSKFGNIDTKHYPEYAKLQSMCQADVIALPTEFLHGLYDGGMGAGLADYWQLIRQSKVAAGGFLWAFVDESVKRADTDGRLDSHGSNAPDGIVGPYREKEASYYTVKYLWSPITIDRREVADDFKGEVTVQNSYSFTDLQRCAFQWELRKFSGPAQGGNAHAVIAQGEARPRASIAPGASGSINIDLPQKWQQADALAFRATDPTGLELWTWVWPIRASKVVPVQALPQAAAQTAPAPSVTETADRLSIRAGELEVAFSKQSGMLIAAARGDRKFALANGPRLVNKIAVAPPPSATSAATREVAAPPSESAPTAPRLLSLKHHNDKADCVVEALYEGSLKSVRWRIGGEGWMQFDYAFNLSGPQEYFGVGFDLPEADVKAMKWLGNGPYRVWQNRLDGGTLGVWQNDINSTITGHEGFKYPEFKGYYSAVRWAQLQTTAGPITAEIIAPELFVQVLAPTYPAGRDSRFVSPAFPNTGVSFLHAIPAIGTKFRHARTSGPQSQPAVADGDYTGSVRLFFGELQKQ